MTTELLSPVFPEITNAIPSKSELHRFLICAAFCDRKTEIPCGLSGEDIGATAACLNALGADICRTGSGFSVSPIERFPENAVLPCGDSGTTLRFLLPAAAVHGVRAEFLTGSSLSARPSDELFRLLREKGCEITKTDGKITLSGKARLDNAVIRGDISSQFISGLMLAMTFHGGAIEVTGDCESRPYIEMTAQALRRFGCHTESDGNRIRTEKRVPLLSPGVIRPSGDWSDSAFLLLAGVLGTHPVTVTGLDPHSAQGDKRIVDLLRQAGANVTVTEDSVTAYPSKLSAFRASVADTPDLAPVLAVAAAAAEGTSVLTGAKRLRYKESDRLTGIAGMLCSLGGKAAADEDSLTIEGGPLRGGTALCRGDHRLLLAASVCTLLCREPVRAENVQAVGKSHPGGWT